MPDCDAEVYLRDARVKLGSVRIIASSIGFLTARGLAVIKEETTLCLALDHIPI